MRKQKIEADEIGFRRREKPKRKTQADDDDVDDGPQVALNGKIGHGTQDGVCLLLPAGG